MNEIKSAQPEFIFKPQKSIQSADITARLFCLGVLSTLSILFVEFIAHNGPKNINAPIDWDFNSPIKLTINKWLWFTFAVLFIMYYFGSMYQTAQYFKQSKHRINEWRRLIENINNQNCLNKHDVKFINLNQHLADYTIIDINYLFMPNQNFGKAFKTLLGLVFQQIVNALCLTAFLNLLYPIVISIGKAILDSIINVSPSLWHFIVNSSYLITHQYLITTLFTIMIVLPFIFANRDKPQWAKYSLLTIQLGGILGVALSLLLI